VGSLGMGIFLWMVIGRRVCCKIGCSANPNARIKLIISGLPERPFRIQLLPCLSMEQALLFERIFQIRLRCVRAKGEWFTHSNALRLSRLVMETIEEAVSVFETFGYETNVALFDLGGTRPLLSVNGFVRGVVV
jgi:hypothetical protein